jgi:hypothetical protein
MRRIAAKVFLSELLLQLVQPFHPKLLPALCCSKKSLNVPTGATQVWADGALPLTRSKSHCKTQAIWMLLGEGSIIRYFRNFRCLHSGYQPRKHFFSGFFRLSLFFYKVLCPRAAIFPAFFLPLFLLSSSSSDVRLGLHRLDISVSCLLALHTKARILCLDSL